MKGTFFALLFVVMGITAEAQSYYRNSSFNINFYPELLQSGDLVDNTVFATEGPVTTDDRWGAGLDLIYFYNFGESFSLGSGLSTSLSFFTHEYEYLGQGVITEQKDDFDALRISVPAVLKYTLWFNEYNKLGFDAGPTLSVYYVQTDEEFTFESDTHQLIYRPGLLSNLEGSGTESGFSGIQLEADAGVHYNRVLGDSSSELQIGLAYHLGVDNVQQNQYILTEFNNTSGALSEGSHTMNNSFAAFKIGFLF